jgi:GMP synthase-like glutamine amidotransferase
VKNLCVIQHVEAEHLGLLEDHLESRSIRFRYLRPFVSGARLPQETGDYDGLVLLGAGPMGVVSGPLIPSVAAELRLAEDFLRKGLPVLGIGAGAIILAVAAGGGAEETPLRFNVEEALRVTPAALSGNMPERFPTAVYMRDRPILPRSAVILATYGDGVPAVFAIGPNSLGFLGHPGIKSAMIEDLVMEFDESPENSAETLAQLRAMQGDIATALTHLAVGIVEATGWM